MLHVKFLTVVVVLSTLLLPFAEAQTTWYVDDDCVPPGTGAELDPFCKIQDGIDAAADGDTVLVADGTYTGFGNRNLSYGGKAITVQSQNGSENCIIDCQMLGRGFEFHNGETSSSVLDGLTIQHGQAESGGAISCHQGGHPTILNCVITDSSAKDAGGGILLGLGSTSTEVSNCLFSGNIAQRGGGMACFESTGTISGCTFTDNVASVTGGGVFFGDGTPQFVNCFFGNNEAPQGGGLYINGQGSRPTFTSCVLRDNSAFQGGGAYFFNDGHPTFGNCLVVGNMAADDGGGFYAADHADLELQNNIFSGNSAIYGGALRLVGGSDVRIQNCVLWGNVASAEGAEIAATGTGTGVGVGDSDVQGGEDAAYVGLNVSWFWDEGNIDSDPLFVDPFIDDFHLSAGSPCIDSASNTSVQPDNADLDGDGDVKERTPIDLDGNPRFVDDLETEDTGSGECPPIVDMGAYEFRADSVCLADLDGNESVGPFDLAVLLGFWGPNPGHPADLDGDCEVGPIDLALLLGNWGPCP